jgi:hypothetical protein
MHRLALTFLVSAGLVLALCDTAAAQQVRRAERLVGANENPPVVTDASGNFRAVIFANRIEFRLRYGPLEGDATQAHLHVGNPGTNGAIVVFLCANDPFAPPAPATAPECPVSAGVVEDVIDPEDVLEDDDGVLEAGDLDGLKRLIRQGAVYANVHSGAHGAGEVRGQISPRIR